MVIPNQAVEWRKYHSAIVEAGDSHEKPEELSEHLGKFMDYAIKHQSMPILNGDTLQPNPYGIEAFIDSPCVKQMERRANGYTFYFNEGNHDTKSQLERIFKGIPNFVVSRKIVIDDWYGDKLVFRHGHGWSPTWFGLRYFAPSFIEFMCDSFPQQWYALSKRFGWMPSHVVNSERYHSEVLSVWGMALRYSQQENCKTIVAHTHMVGGTMAYLDGRFWDYIIADAGVLWAGNFLEIANRIAFQRLQLQNPTMQQSNAPSINLAL